MRHQPKIPVRFGETIKAYIASDSLELSSLRAIPFAIAAWLRYLLAADDELSPMELSDDPRIPGFRRSLPVSRLGKPESCAGQLDAILSDDSIFGADLCKAGLSGTVEGFFKQMLTGRGAVRAPRSTSWSKAFEAKNAYKGILYRQAVYAHF